MSHGRRPRHESIKHPRARFHAYALDAIELRHRVLLVDLIQADARNVLAREDRGRTSRS